MPRDFDTNNDPSSVSRSTEGRGVRTTGRRTSTGNKHRLDPFKPMGPHSSTYAIRGGGRSVERTPLSMALIVLVMVIALVIAIIGFQWVFSAFSSDETVEDSVALGEETTRETIDASLPLLKDIIGLDDDGIVSKFEEDGLSIFEKPVSDESSNVGKELIRLPENVDVATVATYYATGLDSYSVSDLATFLNGAWFLETASSGDQRTLKVKYANLSAVSLETELSALKTQQGFDGETAETTDSGTDDTGNLYESGTLIIDDTTYYWRVAACPLSEVYSFEGTTDSMVYAGATLSQSPLS